MSWFNRSDVWDFFRNLQGRLREELVDFTMGADALPPEELKMKLVERVAVINFVEQLLQEKEDHNE